VKNYATTQSVVKTAHQTDERDRPVDNKGSGDPAYPSMLPRSLIKEALASPSK
jgi:hypothetical protein